MTLKNVANHVKTPNSDLFFSSPTISQQPNRAFKKHLLLKTETQMCL